MAGGYINPLSPKALLSAVSKNEFAAAYYLVGSDDYRIVEAEKYIAGRFLGETGSAGLKRLDARRLKLADLLTELSALPFLGEKLVIAVRDIQRIGHQEVSKVARMVHPADPNRLLIFSSPSDRMPKLNSAFIRGMVDLATVIRFDPLTLQESRGRITRNLEQEGMTIAPDALALMAERLDGNMGAIDNETLKLVAVAANCGMTTVDRELVASTISGYQTFGMFDLATAMLEGQPSSAMRHLHYLFAHGLTGAFILRWVIEHFQALYLLQTHQQPSRVPAWKLRQIRPHVGRLTDDQLAEFLVALGELDSRQRSTVASEGKGLVRELWLEQFVTTTLAARGA